MTNRSSNCYELSRNIYRIDLNKAVMSILILVFSEDLQKGVSKMFLNYSAVEDQFAFSALSLGLIGSSLPQDSKVLFKNLNKI